MAPKNTTHDSDKALKTNLSSTDTNLNAIGFPTPVGLPLAADQHRRLRELGYETVHIEWGSKRPLYRDWPTRVIDDETVKEIVGVDVASIGVKCGRTPVIDIDVLDKNLAQELRALAKTTWPEGLYRTGLPPKFAVLLSRDDTTPTKGRKVSLSRGENNEEKIELDIRVGARQQVVVWGLHPDTKRLYFYEDDKTIFDVPAENLPVLTGRDIERFLSEAVEICERHGFGPDKSKNDLKRVASAAHAPSEPPSESDRQAVIRALTGPNRLYDRHDWIRLMLALQTVFGKEDTEIRQAWIDWSERYDGVIDFEGNDPARTWDSASAPSGELTMGSVIHLLDESGCDFRRAAAAGGSIVSGGAMAPREDRAIKSKTVEPTIMSSAEFVDGFTPPTYICRRLSLQKGQLVTLTAQPGHFKTGVILELAFRMAMGMPVDGIAMKRRRVLFFAGENNDDNRLRFRLTCLQEGIAPADVAIDWVPSAFGMTEQVAQDILAKASARGAYDMVVVDTSTAYFDGEDENSNTEVHGYFQVLRSLTEIPGNPVVVVLTHPAKHARNDDLKPRGGGSSYGTIDGNMTLWMDRGVAKLHHTKWRGQTFAPLYWEPITLHHPSVRDSDGIEMPSVRARELAPEQAKDIEQRDHLRVLSYLRDKPKASQRGISDALDISKGNLCRILEDLLGNEEVQRDKKGKYTVTQKGTERLDGRKGEVPD